MSRIDDAYAAGAVGEREAILADLRRLLGQVRSEGHADPRIFKSAIETCISVVIARRNGEGEAP